MNIGRCVIVLIILVIAGSAGLMAQGDYGSIRGTVFDPAGSVVPGAQVACVKVDTGSRTPTSTTGSGNYLCSSLRPGVYLVEVELPGFKKLVRENVIVDIAGVIALDLTLELGAVTESVTVTAAAPQLKSESSEVGTSLSPRTYIDLPISAAGGRHPSVFMFLVPGVTAPGANPGQGFQTQVNGSQWLSTEVQVDGISMSMAPLLQDSRSLSMPPDAVQEFNMTTSNYGSEFGNTSGGVVQYTIRSGTNDFHGNLYEYLKNDKLDARGFFRPERPITRQNEFGASIGGPIIKNKAFFFFNISWFRQRSGPAGSLLSVPTAAFKTGDLSQLRTPGGELIQLYDPATTRGDGSGGFTRDPFIGNIIPAGRIDPVAANILAFSPDPTLSGIVNNFNAIGSPVRNSNDYTMKFDYQLSTQNQVSVTYNRKVPVDLSAGGLPRPLGDLNSHETNQRTIRLSHNYMISPTIINHRAFGLNRQIDIFDQFSGGMDWGALLGMRGIPSTTVPFPKFNIGPYAFGRDLGAGPGEAKSIYTATAMIYRDSLSVIKGKHNLKFGMEYRRYHITQDTPTGSGIYTYSRNETALPTARGTTGDPYASFLVGHVDRADMFFSDVITRTRINYLALYAQDDIKITPTFTLNVGLRWDLYLPWYEVDDIFSIMDPNLPNPAAGGFPGALTFAGEGPGRTGDKRLTTKLGYRNFGPRLGFAWRVLPDTVIRSAYNISYLPTTLLGSGVARNSTVGFTASPTFISPDVGLTPAFIMGTEGVPEFQRPPFIDPTFGTFGRINMLTEFSHQPSYRQQWNFGIQRQFTPTWLLDVSYVGAKMTRLPSGVHEPNQVHPSFLSQGDLLNKQIDDPAVVAAGFSPPYAGFTGSLAQSLRPFPQYSEVGTWWTFHNGNSSYNALQMKLEKRFSKGFYLLSSYTLSKVLTDSAGSSFFAATSARDNFNRQLEKALSPTEPSQRLVFAFNYELPIGPGKLIGGGTTGAAAKILGGWQLNGVASYQNGTPLVVSVPNTLPLFNRRNLPNVVSGQPLKIAPSNFDPGQGDVYLNINAFALPADFTYGNGPSVPNVRGFAVYDENFGIMKRTNITEQVVVELRYEMFNAFNRVTFGGIGTNVGAPFAFGLVNSQANAPRSSQLALRVEF